MVDDDEFNLSYMQMILKDKLHFKLADCGEKAIELAKKHAFDLIFLDINMPGMDGRETFTAIRKFNHQTPIIALTADAMKGTESELKAFGFSDYFTKPFKETEFLGFLLKRVK